MTVLQNTLVYHEVDTKLTEITYYALITMVVLSMFYFLLIVANLVMFFSAGKDHECMKKWRMFIPLFNWVCFLATQIIVSLAHSANLDQIDRMDEFH